MERHYPNIVDIGKAVKDEIFRPTGLVASAGIAPNKFLAKLASDLRKPDGLVWIPYGTEQAVLAPLPISRLWGVGKVTEEALKKGGYHRIGDISASSPEALKPLLGNQAERIYRLSLGQDKRPLEVRRRPQSVGNEHTYSRDLTLPSEVDEQFRLLANEVAWRLRQSRLMGRTITIKIRYASFNTVTRSLTLSDMGTASEEQLYFSAKRLYNKEKGNRGNTNETLFYR